MRIKKIIPRRRGIASVLAMLFVVLFAVMALGFFNGVTTSVQLAGNEKRQNEATFAAESGLQFITYHLANLTAISSSDMGVVFDSMLTQLGGKLNGSVNLLDGAAVQHDLPSSAGTSLPRSFYIPNTSTVNGKTVYNWMRLGNGGSCCMVVKLAADKSKITIAAIGQSSGLNPSMRALQYDVKATSSTGTAPWSAPNGSIVTYSSIYASNGVTISGSVMALPPTSQTPATVIGGSRITGTLSYPASYPSPTVNNGGSIASTSTIGTIPAAPTFDTSAFATLVPPTTQTPLGSSWQSGQKFAGTVLNSSSQVGSANTFNNVRIKPNSNITFGNGNVINGVVYIESPNKVTFAGATVNGVIISDNSSSSPYNSSTQNNVVTINNGTALKGTSNITTNIDPSEVAHMNTLKSMFLDSTGAQVNASTILTPNFGLNFQGGMTVNGASAIVGSQFTIANGSAISLSGVLLNLGSSQFNVGGGMTITKTGLPAAWPGIVTGSTSNTTVGINRGTYAEVNYTTWLQ